MLEWFAREKALTKACLINLALFVMAEFAPLPPEAASRSIGRFSTSAAWRASFPPAFTTSARLCTVAGVP